MKSKNLFVIKECYFNLPDDFNGTCGNALMLLAMQRLEQEKSGTVNVLSEVEGSDNYSKVLIPS